MVRSRAVRRVAGAAVSLALAAAATAGAAGAQAADPTTTAPGPSTPTTTEPPAATTTLPASPGPPPAADAPTTSTPASTGPTTPGATAAPTTRDTTPILPGTATSGTGPHVAGVAPDGADLPDLGDPRLDPDLSRVAVDNPEFRKALTAYRATQQHLATAQATEADRTRELADLAAADARLVGQLNQATRRKEKSDARLAALRGTLEHIAVDDYMRGESTSAADLDLDLDASTDFRRHRVVLKTVRANQLAQARANAEVVDAMTSVILASQAELDEVRARTATATAARDQAVADQRRDEALLVAQTKAMADARMTGDVPGLDFSIVVLDAYYKAAKRMALEKPSCRIRWSLVAGISRTEGRHGTYNGSTVDADGNVDPPILGIALDGSNGTATVGDSDGGELDGDATTDRAVGPMQFIPSTWARWGRDGNGDGTADPQNMYDATLAAAAYLCYYGPGLDTDAGIKGAVIHYNASDDYVALVWRRAKGYDELTFPTAPKLDA